MHTSPTRTRPRSTDGKPTSTITCNRPSRLRDGCRCLAGEEGPGHAHERMKPSRAVASFDSASAMLRALASFLHGRDTPMLGQFPSVLEPLLDGSFGTVNRLPRRVQEAIYAWSGWAEAIPLTRSARSGPRPWPRGSP